MPHWDCGVARSREAESRSLDPRRDRGTTRALCSYRLPRGVICRVGQGATMLTIGRAPDLPSSVGELLWSAAFLGSGRGVSSSVLFSGIPKTRGNASGFSARPQPSESLPIDLACRASPDSGVRSAFHFKKFHRDGMSHEEWCAETFP